jgi:protein-L-isoaspartate(D-aspartate) O-methyltransferase
VVAKLAGQVTATESDSVLSARATAALAELGLANVTVRSAAAAEGYQADAPYDVIVLNGATEILPEGLFRQLKGGGRLVGVFATTQPPRATIVTHSHDDFGHRALFDAVAPVLPGLERLPAFVF